MLIMIPLTPHKPRDSDFGYKVICADPMCQELTWIVDMQGGLCLSCYHKAHMKFAEDGMPLCRSCGKPALRFKTDGLGGLHCPDCSLPWMYGNFLCAPSVQWLHNTLESLPDDMPPDEQDKAVRAILDSLRYDYRVG